MCGLLGIGFGSLCFMSNDAGAENISRFAISFNSVEWRIFAWVGIVGNSSNKKIKMIRCNYITRRFLKYSSSFLVSSLLIPMQQSGSSANEASNMRESH